MISGTPEIKEVKKELSFQLRLSIVLYICQSVYRKSLKVLMISGNSEIKDEERGFPFQLD